ncbi:MAG: MOSC domain-containing protein [Ilumatobacteraceae bacterium]
MTSPLVASVNVAPIAVLDHRGRSVTSAIGKQPVAGRVATVGDNLAGDDQADRSVHGGPDRAVYAYASEDLEWWAGEIGRPVPAGSMGENLTTTGVDVTGATVGERWRIGTVVLEVTAPRVPCFKLGIRMGDPRFPQRFARAGRPGAYLRIIEHGELAAGDSITIVDRPAHGVTVELVARAYHDDQSLASRLLAAPQLEAGWIAWARSHAS